MRVTGRGLGRRGEGAVRGRVAGVGAGVGGGGLVIALATPANM